MFCCNCGSPLEEKTRFCGNCGVRVLLPELLTEAPVPAPPAEETSAPVIPSVSDGASQAGPAIQPIPATAASPLSRPYRLTTLATAVTYGIQAEAASLGLSLAAIVLFLPSIFRIVSSENLEALNLESLLKDPKILTLLVIYALAYVAGLLLGIRVAGVIRKRLSARPPEVRPLSVADFLLCAMVAYALWMLGVLAGNFPSFLAPLESIQFGWYQAPMWLVAVVVAPIFEELVFRKFVLDRVGDLGEGVAVLTSALIFGLAHKNAGQFFLAFFLGLLFARIYLRTGKILYTILLHFMINMTATADEIGCLIWGDRFDVGFMLVVGGLALAGLVLWLVFRKRHFLLRRCDPIPARDRNAAMRCWPMTLVKILCLVSVGASAVSNTAVSVFLSEGADWNPLGLLYLIPAAGAVITTLVLTRRLPEPRIEGCAPVDPLLMSSPACSEAAPQQ